MAIDTEETIRARAYELWQEAGRPDGQDKEFWARAERQLAEKSGFDSSEEDADAGLPPMVPGLPMH